MERPCRAEWYATTSAAAMTSTARTVIREGSPGPSPTPYSFPGVFWAFSMDWAFSVFTPPRSQSR